MSLSIAMILPMIERYGVLFTNIASAVLAWGAFGYVRIPRYNYMAIMPGSHKSLRLAFGRLLWFTIRYGDRLRAVVDVGFSKAEYN